MGELVITLVGWLVSPIINKLVSTLIDEVTSYLGDDIDNDIAKELEDLRMKILPVLEYTIVTAQRSPPDNIAPLAEWLACLKNAYEDAARILAELKVKATGETMRPSTSKMSKKAVQKEVKTHPKKKELLARLMKLKNVAADAKNFRKLLPKPDNNPSATTFLLPDGSVFGRDRDREEVINFLLNKQLGGSSSKKKYSVIAVTGKGGVGKTTFAKYVYNDKRVDEYFDKKMWISLSQNLDVIKHTKKVIEWASEVECPNLHNLGMLHKKLLQILSESKNNNDNNIMVVLDDVWYNNNNNITADKDWENFLLPFTCRHVLQGTCKIVVTTRSTLLPYAIKPEAKYKLPELTEDDFISLLSYHSIDDLKPKLGDLIPRNEIVEEIAKIMVKMRKEPLAAKIVGKQLGEQTDIEFWQKTLNELNSAFEVYLPRN